MSYRSVKIGAMQATMASLVILSGISIWLPMHPEGWTSNINIASERSADGEPPCSFPAITATTGANAPRGNRTSGNNVAYIIAASSANTSGVIYGGEQDRGLVCAPAHCVVETPSAIGIKIADGGILQRQIKVPISTFRYGVAV